ncbi:hypothetical protein MPC1_4710001 [Methylocella tundrae]|uniref:Uncharacterized protein n=1 Tax=Methylocella tundrae TaxID=227605 RepID=A0A4U8Z697_METTU|nr:protein of unknown function [Methylocella tundrae]VTZ27110.1 hypothetical protein MPC1_4710001 [Methylocella tundrae]
MTYFPIPDRTVILTCFRYPRRAGLAMFSMETSPSGGSAQAEHSSRLLPVLSRTHAR